MAGQIQIKLTRQQLETVIYELEQSIIGDNDSYDRKLKTIIKKMEESLDGHR